jgi:sugar phosphate isomerase/epimerase
MTDASALRLGCQTYTWEMLGDAFAGGPDDLLKAIADAGYEGLEITDTMIGPYADDPEGFGAALDRHGLTLVGFAYAAPSGYTERERIAEDLEITRRWTAFAAHFPGAMLSMGSATVMSEGPRAGKYDVAAEVYNRSHELAAASGVGLAVHPSSHHDTLLYDAGDYAEIFSRLEPEVGWVPDTGHILRGGQTLRGAISRWKERIRYVHLKDVDATGDWAMLGTGICDVAALVRDLADAPNFNGWLVIEEESQAAAGDPAAAVRRNRETAAKVLSGMAAG